MHLMFSALTALIALILAFCHGQNSISYMLMKGTDSPEEFLAEYHKHEIQGRMICSMSRFYPNKKIMFYHEFAIYECISGKAELYSCFGNHLFTPSNFTGSAVKSTHYCRQFVNQYLYSDEPDDQMHIWDIEKKMCHDERKGEGSAKFFAFYNYKLVSCKDNKYRLEACVLNTGIVLADSNIAAQVNMSTHHKDICYQLAIKTAAPIEEIFFNKDPYTGIQPVKDDGFGDMKKFAKWRHLHSVNNIQNFHKSILCKHLKMKIVFYEFGLFECKDNELVLIHCLYKDLNIDTKIIKREMYEKSGDYIDDLKDLRFCGQVAHLFLDSKLSHDQKTMWKHEDFVCDLMYKKENLKLPKYGEPVPNLSKWHLYQKETTNNRFSGYAIYQNFQVMQCDPFKKLPFLTGCLFDSKYFPLENAMEELKKNGIDMHEYHRDFCFELGNISMLIKESVIKRQIKHLESGLKLDRKVRPWEDNTISYHINSGVSNSERRRLNVAIKEYEKYTCLKFKQLNEDVLVGNYINIVQEGGECISHWRGMRYPAEKQKMNINPKCNVLYHLGLNVGLIDEFQRPDRDRWITLNPKLLQAQKDYEHYKYYSLENHPAYHDEIYDFQSIFHHRQNRTFENAAFEAYRFGKGGSALLANGLTYCDVAKINRFYQCSPRIYLTNCNGLYGDISPLLTRAESAIDAKDSLI